MKSLLIIGAGGYGQLVKEIAELNGYEKVDFIDDNTLGAIGGIDEAEKIEDGYDRSIVAIGNPVIRKSVFEKLKKSVIIVHPSAVISPSAKVETGCVVEAGVVISANTTVRKGSFICAGAIVNHNAVVGEFSQVDCNAVVSSGAFVPNGMKVNSCTVYRTPQRAVGEEKMIATKREKPR